MDGLVIPQIKSRYVITSMSLTSHTVENEHDIEEMKEDIARMRQEALKRLELLNEQLHPINDDGKNQLLKNQNKDIKQPTPNKQIILTTTTTIQQDQQQVQPPSSSIPTSNSFPIIPTPPQVENIHSFDESEQIEALMKARMEREKLHFLDPVVPNTRAAANQKLLDDTRWRLMLNIGREPGTWMPKTWGVSGDRLRLHLELEFSSDQLYEREEFLNGVSGAKILNIVHGQADLAPTMQHGGRQIRLKDTGGWRVAPNDGPMGTSVLRFYFDIEEETRHPGSDVYCPAGRIYCTCGYFPMQERQQQGYVSEKDVLKQEMRNIEVQYETLANENELDTNLLSWNKVQRSKKMMDLRMQATKLNTRMHEAQVREPDKSLLRLSQDQSVGLTREGGVCCKVHKGLAIEYHILGKFEIASMTNREHMDYRDLLP